MGAPAVGSTGYAPAAGGEAAGGVGYAPAAGEEAAGGVGYTGGGPGGTDAAGEAVKAGLSTPAPVIGVVALLTELMAWEAGRWGYVNNVDVLSYHGNLIQQAAVLFPVDFSS